MLDYPEAMIIGSVIGLILSYFIYCKWIPELSKKIVDIIDKVMWNKCHGIAEIVERQIQCLEIGVKVVEKTLMMNE